MIRPRTWVPCAGLGLFLFAGACRPGETGAGDDTDGAGGSSGTEGPCDVESEPQCGREGSVMLERCVDGAWVGEDCEDFCRASAATCALGCISHEGTSACLCAEDPALCPGHATCANLLSIDEADGTRVYCNNVCAALPETPLTAGCGRDADTNVDECICVAAGDPCDAGALEFCAGPVDDEALLPPPVPDIVTCEAGAWTVRACQDDCDTTALGCFVDSEKGGLCVCEDP